MYPINPKQPSQFSAMCTNNVTLKKYKFHIAIGYRIEFVATHISLYKMSHQLEDKFEYKFCTMVIFMY